MIYDHTIVVDEEEDEMILVLFSLRMMTKCDETSVFVFDNDDDDACIVTFQFKRMRWKTCISASGNFLLKKNLIRDSL